MSLRRTLVALSLSSAALTPACASGAGAKAAESEVADWELDGWRVIACCCAAPCPCRINKKPMNCHGCDHTDVVHVERGTLGGTSMDGVTWIVVGRGFGQDVEGNWAQVYVDERASDAQVKAVGDFLAGAVQGWGARAPYLAGKFLGVREVPMSVTVSSDRTEYAASIPGVLALETRAIFNPGRMQPVVSTGIMDSFGDRFVHSDTPVHTFDDPSIGHAWDLTGKQSNQAEFVLNQRRVDEGHLGWGCWSAHTSFGDGEPYGEEQVGHAGHE